MTALLILTAFFLLTLVIGIRARQKQKMNLENWAVGGRSFNTVFVFLLTAGEVYTTFSFLGGSGWAYSKGISAVYVMVYIALSYVTSYFLLPLIWKYAHKHRLVSQSDSRKNTTVICSAWLLQSLVSSRLFRLWSSN
ncbi:hypothetical protein [Listeria newyorkensis]|uniref:hypothetical protein n=1 Tax=Listeria newyorkensis TaxID=1497681 RepID=UPI00207BCB30|nr:hypothetical protein [Listeria newyorkensis]